MSKLPASPTVHFGDLLSARKAVLWADLEQTSKVRLAYSGRCALYQYLMAMPHTLDSARRRYVLLPAFQCPTVVDPVLHAGFSVRFYTITDNLEIDPADFMNKLDEQVAAVLFIRYFGLGGIPDQLAAAARAAGAKLIHDCSHSFLTANPLGLAGLQADAAIYSFWKLLPSATIGGGAWCAEMDEFEVSPPQAAVPLVDGMRFAKQVLGDLKDNLLSAVRPDAPEALINPVPAARKHYAEAYPYDKDLARAKMPRLAQHILRCASLDRVASSRRTNYVEFVGGVDRNDVLLFPVTRLNEEDVPWGVPVLLKQRYERDYLLRAAGVPIFSFGEVLHPLLFEAAAGDTQMLDVTRYLSEHLIGISIHQQLTVSHMRRYAEITNRFVRELG